MDGDKSLSQLEEAHQGLDTLYAWVFPVNTKAFMKSN